MNDAAQRVVGPSHAHEEDHDGLRVFRPSGTGLPPSRGRESFSLHEDHSVVRGTPGPADAGARQSGHWDVDGELLRLDLAGSSVTYEIVHATEDRLELRPAPPEGGET